MYINIINFEKVFNIIILGEVNVKVKVSSYIAQYPIFMIAQGAFYTLLPGRPVQSKTISASLGSIQPRGIFAKTACTQVFITVYSHVLTHTAD